MIDIQFIRNAPDAVREGLKKRGRDIALVDEFLAVDALWRERSTSLDVLRAELNELSKARNIEEAKKKKEIIKVAEAVRRELEIKRAELLDRFPNTPAADAPVGKDDSENKLIREVGEKREFNFEPKDYLTIAEALGVIDVKKAAEVSGSRFGYLKGKAALLEFALLQLAMKTLVTKGFVPVVPPVMIRPEVFKGMGRLAADQRDERYYLPSDDAYLVGSAEHTVGPIHMNETLRAKDLPKRYVAFSTCFRREAGSYGKDTKGILRVHQFDKVEMFSFADPEKSEAEHAFLLACQEELLSALKIPYRVVEICTGDMGWTDAKAYDCESWMPGQPSTSSGQENIKGAYRETNSCSNTTDFQARGIGAKLDKGGFVHMLNATGFAMGRMIIAIIENYQTETGDFEIPEALKPFFPQI